MLDITLLGTGGGMPMPNRHLSSTIITYNGRKILFDCGEGTQVAMRKWRTGFRSIDIILLTHFHGDHTFGLPGLLATIGNSDRRKPIIVIGPAGLKYIMSSVLNLTGKLPFDIKLIEEPKMKLGFNIKTEILELVNQDKSELYISNINLEHSSQCLGYKIYVPRSPKFNPQKAIEYDIPVKYWSILQSGREVEYNGRIFKANMVLGEEREGLTFSYVTDSRPNDQITEFVRDSNYLVCEGTYGDDADLDKARKNTHMTFSEAAELAKAANVDKLLLTHFSPSMDSMEKYREETTRIFKNTIIGYDGYKESITY